MVPLMEMSGWTLFDLDMTVKLDKNKFNWNLQASDGSIGVDFTQHDITNNSIYLAAPSEYLGKRLHSYGGFLNYTIFYTIDQNGLYIYSFKFGNTRCILLKWDLSAVSPRIFKLSKMSSFFDKEIKEKNELNTICLFFKFINNTINLINMYWYIISRISWPWLYYLVYIFLFLYFQMASILKFSLMELFLKYQESFPSMIFRIFWYTKIVIGFTFHIFHL